MRESLTSGSGVILKSSLEIASYVNNTSSNQTFLMPYQLWYSGIYDFDYEEFDLKEIEDVYTQLSYFQEKSQTYFEPRVFTFSCGKEDNCSPQLIEEQCISSGRYCVMFPQMPGLRVEHSNNFKKNHKKRFFEEILR